jgi:aryl-alcohol dehydrogenase-like predicted oxidoreductase
MHYRIFGTTGLYVSEVCFGTMTFGGKGIFEMIGNLGEVQAEALVGTALDAGINLIDTADVYSVGDAETMLGKALANLKRPRDQVIIATKVRGRTGMGENQRGLSRAHIFAAVEASLRRLRLDHIDLYQIHGDDYATPIEETVRALDDLVRSGKVRYLGFCNLPAWMAMKAIGYADARGLNRFVSAQMYYTVADRDIEREVVPLIKDQRLALMPWSPLAGGLLSGKFDLESPGPEGSRRASFDFPPVNRERTIAVLKALRAVAKELNFSVARVAIAWLLSRPFVTTVILGAKTVEQLTDTIAATDVTLSPEQIAQLDAAGELLHEYPGWMVVAQNHMDPPPNLR